MSGDKRHIDWEDVKNRLRANQQALEEALAVSPERLAAVYRQRAVEFARRQAVGTTHAAALRVLVFVLAGEFYALNFMDLAAILPFAGCTPVPGGPPVLLGVTNIEGEIRSVVDLAQLIGLPARTANNADNSKNRSGPAGYILLISGQGRQVGLRVDELDKIRRLTPEELSVPGENETGPALRFLWALTEDHLKLLSTEAICTHPIFQKEVKK